MEVIQLFESPQEQILLMVGEGKQRHVLNCPVKQKQPKACRGPALSPVGLGFFDQL